MDRRFPKFAALLALCLAPLLAACADDTPQTQLSWGVNERVAPPRHRPAAPVKTARADTSPRTYVYQDAGEDIISPPVPTPRPSYKAPVRTAAAPRSVPVYEYHDDVKARPADTRPAAGNAVFAWPINGPLLSTFGTARNGERNDGINISARQGTPIHAAASGTVSFADNLNGYGNLMLIKHANGYITAYAHADRLLVGQGDYVMKGQVIGYAGRTGDVTSPQLHFEIRNGTTPVNPERYLVSRAGA